MTLTTTKKLIGQGAFTKAFLLESGKVELHSCDPVKECMAHGWFSDHRLFPQIKFTDKDEVYLMKYYPKVKSLKNNLTTRQWKLYNVLREVMNEHNRLTRGVSPANFNYKLHDALDKMPSEFREERYAIKEAVDGLGNYGTDICFEISPRNVAVSGGKLIMLDCFFMLSAIDRVNRERNNKRNRAFAACGY